MNKSNGLFFLCLMLSSGCSTTHDGKNKQPQKVATIAINIRANDNHHLNFVNLDYYRLKVLDVIDDFLSVDLDLVELDESPEVTLDIDINNFVLWPRDERLVRRTLSRVILVGRDQTGNPIYQTVRAVADIVQIQRRSNASFVAQLTIKANPPFTFKHTFSPNYNYVNTYVENIQGDPRAVDISIYASSAPPFEPREEDFLLELSNNGMLPRLSSELRKYYNKK